MTFTAMLQPGKGFAQVNDFSETTGGKSQLGKICDVDFIQPLFDHRSLERPEVFPQIVDQLKPMPSAFFVTGIHRVELSILRLWLQKLFAAVQDFCRLFQRIHLQHLAEVFLLW